MQRAHWFQPPRSRPATQTPPASPRLVGRSAEPPSGIVACPNVPAWRRRRPWRLDGSLAAVGRCVHHREDARLDRLGQVGPRLHHPPQIGVNRFVFDRTVGATGGGRLRRAASGCVFSRYGIALWFPKPQVRGSSPLGRVSYESHRTRGLRVPADRGRCVPSYESPLSIQLLSGPELSVGRLHVRSRIIERHRLDRRRNGSQENHR